MTTLPLAAAGIEAVIWIIILIFWSIAQYVQKNRNAQRRPPLRPGQPPPPHPAAPPRPTTPVERELQDLLRELTGQPPVAEEEEELAPAPAPPPAPVQPPPPPRRRPVVHRSHASVPAPAPVSRPASLPVLEEPSFRAEPSLAEISEGVSHAFAHSGKMPGLTLRMRGVEMKGMSMKTKAGASSRTGQPAFKLSTLRNPATLRNAIIARMVLDKPKAFEMNPAP